MKSILIFLFGAACGVGGTILWLRKDIKEELDQIRIDMKDSEVPFTVQDEKDEEKKAVAQGVMDGAAKAENVMKQTPVSQEDRTKYRTMIQNIKDGVDAMEGTESGEEDVGDVDSHFSETDGGIYEIDKDTYLNDKDCYKKELVFYRGDGVMATEAGTKIDRPAMLVGGEWERCVGTYEPNVAYIHNSKDNTNYAIYVEYGTYADEYGNY